ncbi:MAG: hypothetical protein QXN16_04340 [Candidatus Micrarchaeaceae archaeon]
MVKKGIFSRISDFYNLMRAFFESRNVKEFQRKLNIEDQLAELGFNQLQSYNLLQAYSDSKTASEFARKAHIRKQRGLRIWKMLKEYEKEQQKRDIWNEFVWTVNYNNPVHPIYIDIMLTANKAEYDANEWYDFFEAFIRNKLAEFFGSSVSNMIEFMGIEEVIKKEERNREAVYVDILWKHEKGAHARSKQWKYDNIEDMRLDSNWWSL